MNLQGSIADLQKNAAQLYLKFEQRFKENGLIREIWNSMAHDILQQIQSLEDLPPSLWRQLNKDQSIPSEEVLEISKTQVNEKKEDIPIKECFESALSLEEAMILKIYVPIIRCLRKNWTNPALDFYIMVKAHSARIMRVMESFSGDPVAIQRCNLLLRNFEKDVQEPEIVDDRPKRPTVSQKPSPKRKAARQKHPSKSAQSLTNRASIRLNRTKSLVKKVELHSRRAHR